MVCVARPPTCGRPEDVFKLKGCLSPAATVCTAFPLTFSVPPSLNPLFPNCRVLHNWRHLDTDRRRHDELQLTAGGQLSS